jgi:hypothetical protein
MKKEKTIITDDYLINNTKIKSGDLIAWTHKGWSTLYDIEMQIIRLATRSEYIHVGTAWIAQERVFVIEAVMPCVRIFPLSHLVPFYLVPLEAPWEKKTENFAFAQIGKEYSIKNAIQSVIEKPNVNGNWQCAQLAHEIMKRDGIDLGEVYTPSGVVYGALSLSQDKSLKLVR